MQAQFRPEKANGLNTTLQFDLTGDGGGTWTVQVQNGQCRVKQGPAGNPSATISATAADYVAIANNQLNPMQAMMQGRLKIKGDVALLLKLPQVFSIKQ